MIAFYAVLRIGAVVVEHNPLYTASELGAMFADHGATVAIAWDVAAPRIARRSTSPGSTSSRCAARATASARPPSIPASRSRAVAARKAPARG